MQKKSDLWVSLWENPMHEEEVKLVISGVDYTHGDIVADSLNTSGGVFDQQDFGNCASGQMNVEIYPKGTIPKQAEIKVFKRLVLGDQISEWKPNGVYFISTRQKNKITGTVAIHAFDAMLKAGEVWLTPEYDLDDWPKSEDEAARDIASRMGVELDERTRLDNRVSVDYPIDENGELTMTDILEGIATANWGNWIITDEGRLRLIRWGDIPEETFYLVTEYGRPIKFGGVGIHV